MIMSQSLRSCLLTYFLSNVKNVQSTIYEGILSVIAQVVL